MSNVLINEYLQRLRLPTITKNYERLADEALANKASFQEYLCCLLEQEVQSRQERTRKQRIADAKFPALKTLDAFEFEEIPTLNKSLVLKLFKGNYLPEAENIVFVGGQGTGKTHLGIALGIQACLFQVISSRYERGSTLITTNLEFPEWNSVFGTQKLTAALLDRLTHRCHVVEANGESYRFKQSLRRKEKNKGS